MKRFVVVLLVAYIFLVGATAMTPADKQAAETKAAQAAEKKAVAAEEKKAKASMDKPGAWPKLEKTPTK